MKRQSINNLFYIPYIFLLVGILPHLAWAFNHFQEDYTWRGVPIGYVLAWVLAIVFDGSMFGFTYRLKGRIEQASKFKPRQNETLNIYGVTIRPLFAWRKFSSAYLNIFGLLILLSSGVSMLANFSHAVEFGQPFKAFDAYGLPPLLYFFAFGAILPVMSFMFARVLADVTEAEQERSDSEQQAKISERAAKRGERKANEELNSVRGELEKLRERLGAYEQLSAPTAKERIKAAQGLWPKDTQAKWAGRADVSTSHASGLLNKNGAVK